MANRKFEDTVRDENGNLRAVSSSTGPGGGSSSSSSSSSGVTLSGNTYRAVGRGDSGKYYETDVQLGSDGKYHEVTERRNLSGGAYTPGTMIGGNSSYDDDDDDDDDYSPGYRSSYTKREAPEYNFTYDPYKQSDTVTKYETALQTLEGQKPGAYSSRYEGAIQSILNKITNREDFNIATDPNYNQLYNLYAEQYRNNADRAMRDTMGSASQLTGGYGNTYAQVAGQQAYDQIMSGLNAQNINLMDLAYGMYRDAIAEDYNQLGAYQTQDNTEYGRYRDTVGDYYTDLANATNRFYNEREFDYGKYLADRGLDQDIYDKALAQLNYNDETAYNRDFAERQFAYQQAMDELAQSNYEDELAYNRSMAEDDSQYSRYNSALSTALQLQKAGYNVPDYLLNQIGGSMPTAIAPAVTNYGGSTSAYKPSSSTKTTRTDLVDVMNLARNTGASQAEKDDIWNDMTDDEKLRYRLQMKH